ncbi:uncharacterized protein BX663DRAFT_517335 [Cokeromyces recurvatus]|uniref:uncharacterized protein n=1 Tax=Cokeromyces recurvatus TaxID=90255 RepID=UPI00221F7357|nr:uncharacterized protein BX663DRAFT_517335 [Cokeromyces recurvatus]KAI7900704.1 hypothetical protein BX663DRAFT_517335 [Cokeromyces recurvatus]
MTTILTEITEKEQQKLLIEKSNQTYSSLQLNVTNEKELPAKYISTANTIETKQELTNRSRILRNKEDNSSIYHIFLKSILYTLHFVYIFFTSIRLLNTYLYNLYISTRYDDIRKRIQHDKLQLTKIPNHLTIIISRELLSTRSCQDWERIMSEISTLTCWAYEFGTKEISVYDATGNSKTKKK